MAGGAVRPFLQIKMGQQLEGKRRQHAAGGAGGRQQNIGVAVAQADGIQLINGVIGQIIRREQTAVGCLIGQQRLGQRAALGVSGSFAGQGLQRGVQIGHKQMIAALNHTAVGREYRTHPGGVGVQWL